MSDREPTDTDDEQTDNDRHRGSDDSSWTRDDVKQAGDTTRQPDDRDSVPGTTPDQSSENQHTGEHSEDRQPTTRDRSKPTNQQEASPRTNQSDQTSRFSSGMDAIRLLKWGGLATACLVAFVALMRFYAHSTSAIATFAAPEYESLFLAGFNLVVLLAAGIAISLLVRELAGGNDGGVPMSANK